MPAATLATAAQDLARAIVAHAEQLLAEAIEAELRRLNGAGPGEAVEQVEAEPEPDRQPEAASKRCNRCDVVKPLADFPADAKLPDGRRGTCNACRARRRKAKTKTTKPKTRPRATVQFRPARTPARWRRTARRRR